MKRKSWCIIGGGDIIEEPQKIYVAGVAVTLLNERVQHLDANGKLITESLIDYTRKSLLKEFSSLDNFLTRWNSAEKKIALLDELEHGRIVSTDRRDSHTYRWKNHQPFSNLLEAVL
jgi:type I restriction enzyme, R subunit